MAGLWVASDSAARVVEISRAFSGPFANGSGAFAGRRLLIWPPPERQNRSDTAFALSLRPGSCLPSR